MPENGLYSGGTATCNVDPVLKITFLHLRLVSHMCYAQQLASQHYTLGYNNLENAI